MVHRRKRILVVILITLRWVRIRLMLWLRLYIGGHRHNLQGGMLLLTCYPAFCLIVTILQLSAALAEYWVSFELDIHRDADHYTDHWTLTRALTLTLTLTRTVHQRWSAVFKQTGPYAWLYFLSPQSWPHKGIECTNTQKHAQLVTAAGLCQVRRFCSSDFLYDYDHAITTAVCYGTDCLIRFDGRTWYTDTTQDSKSHTNLVLLSSGVARILCQGGTWAAPQVLNRVCLFPLPFLPFLPLPFPTLPPHPSLHSLPLPGWRGPTYPSPPFPSPPSPLPPKPARGSGAL